MYKKYVKNQKEKVLDKSRAFGYVTFLLGLRLYSVEEIRVKMRKHGFASTIITEVVEDLLQKKYLNDPFMAEAMIESFKRYKDYGYLKVKYKLAEKKISNEVAESALADFFSEEDELIVAKRLKNKIAPVLPNEFGEKKKIMAKFASRGFRASVIHSIFKNAE